MVAGKKVKPSREPEWWVPVGGGHSGVSVFFRSLKSLTNVAYFILLSSEFIRTSGQIFKYPKHLEAVKNQYMFKTEYCNEPLPKKGFATVGKIPPEYLSQSLNLDPLQSLTFVWYFLELPNTIHDIGDW